MVMTKWIGALLGGILLHAGAVAGTAASDAAVPAIIKSRIESSFPGVQVEQVHPAPWAGLYEVLTDTELVYTTADAAVVFSGNVVDVKTKRDLTGERLGDLRSIDWSALPLDLAIKVVKGDGSRRLAVFADPLCPYCQQLESTLKDITNVTVYTFPFPLEFLHPGATEKARQIWCSADRGAVWTGWMLNRTTTPANADCDTKGLTAAQELGMKLKVDSTPTLFFNDGRRFAGAMDKEGLEQRLAAAQASGAGANASKEKVGAATALNSSAPPG